MVYSAVHDEIAQEYGEAKAEEILKRAIYKRGAAICGKFKAYAPADFSGLRDAFLDFVPDHGKMFAPEVVFCDHEPGHQVSRLPAEGSLGRRRASPKRIETLCRIAGFVDNGTFEQAGFESSPIPGSPASEGCCFLHIRPQGLTSSRRLRARRSLFIPRRHHDSQTHTDPAGLALAARPRWPPPRARSPSATSSR